MIEGIIIKITKTTVNNIIGITFFEMIDLFICFTENAHTRIIIRNKIGFINSENPEYNPSAVVRMINGR